MTDPIIFRKLAVSVLLVYQMFVVIMYYLFVKYDPAAKPSPMAPVGNVTTENPRKANWNEADETYPFFQDIQVMIFVGFGFLMAFLKKYAHSSISFSFLIAALAMELAILLHGFLSWSDDYVIYLGLDDMIYGDVAAVTVLITLGIVLGKVTPIGLVFLTNAEIVLYVVNEYLCTEILQSMDSGGSVYLHAFGAYFGLGVSAAIAKKTNTIQENNLESSSYYGDVFAMIGTLFLWMFWPSFLGAGLAEDQRYRAIINTYLAIISSCIVAFAVSSAVNKEIKFRMSQIQNATLAGGVAIGSTCNTMIHPYGALFIGGAGGALSVCGFAYVQEFLRKWCHIHDTCGAHNLHGIPGILGGITGIFTAAFASREVYGSELESVFPAMAQGRSGGLQALFQVIGLVVTLGISIVGGFITGVFLRYIFLAFNEEYFYKDDVWFVEDDEP